MKKLLYFILILLTFYLGMMYEWPAGAGLLSAELIFLLLCVLLAFCTRRRINITLHMNRETVEQGDTILASFYVENTSLLPAAVTVTYRASHAGKAKMKRTRKVYTAGKQTVSRELPLMAKHCGKMELQINRIWVSDCWGLFSFPRRQKKSASVMVMPRPYPVSLTVRSATRWFPIDGESYAQDKSGDDNTEIYEVRKYQAGDRMQKVHWKLSAKEEELYIKEFSYPLGAAVILLLDGTHPGKPEDWHLFLEAVVSISAALLNKECPHYIVWKTKDSPLVNRKLILKEEHFHEFLPGFLMLDYGSLETDMEERYRYEYRGCSYSTMIRITALPELQINSQELLNMAEPGLKNFFETVELIV